MKKHDHTVALVIQAGGQATRMGALCLNTPKAMLCFDNIPFLVLLQKISD